MKTVLIVDDDNLVRRSVARIIRGEAFDAILEAINGEEALSLLRERNADLPSLIISDGEMPVMGGPDLILELRKIPEFMNIPVILCSGNSNLARVADLLGVPFFAKAHDEPVDLRAMVRKALAKAV